MLLNKILGDFFAITPSELEILSELDSRKFGHIKLNDESNVRKKKIALKAIAFMEHTIGVSQQEARKQRQTNLRKRRHGEDTPSKKEFFYPNQAVDPKVYKKLGHLHLLLENYSKALSAYEKYAALSPNKCADDDVDFLYGKGLVYFHFGAYHLAVQALQQVIYMNPSFERAKDVHARLGIMRKIMRNFTASLKHFSLARRYPQPGSFSEHEISFHIAHLREVEGKSVMAMELYNELLRATDLPNSIRAEVHRQLGWMFYSLENLGEKHIRIPQAIQNLQKSLELDPKSGQCLYLLGRCYASIGKVHEAFVAYRNSVDKSESNADTWCSIGILYQQQNQPMDALQAYICAVQLEKYHGPAWTNLGLLYESSMQLQDALTCYCNAASKNKHPNSAIQQRIKYLKTQLSSMPPQSASLKVRNLPCLEEAWNLPVSNEMTGRHGSSNKSKGDGASSKKSRQDSDNIKPLSQTQLQTLQYLQSLPNLLPQQQQLLQQLQAQYQAFKQHQIKQQAGNRPEGVPKTEEDFNPTSCSNETPPTSQSNNPADLLFDLQNKDLGNVSDKELEALISQQDIGSFAESLLKEIEADGASLGIEGGDNVEGADDVAGANNKDSEVKVSSLDIPTELDIIHKAPDLALGVDSKGEDVVNKCKEWAKAHPDGSFPLRRNLRFPHRKPQQRKSTASTSKEALLPPTPNVYLENKKDAFSPKLQQFCLQHPITVVRGIAGALKLDLGLFSTKTIVEIGPKHPIEVMTQVRQKSDENWDPTFSKQVWLCENRTSIMNLRQYAAYQTATFQDGLREEQDRTQTSSSVIKPESEEEMARRHKKMSGILQLGNCLDLSDLKLWRGQLTELMKLPSWARVVSGGNMLSHLGYSLTGINTVNLQMGVPQARISAQQDSNGFCSIYINIGPGECEWFAIPFEYWGALLRLCEKNGVDFCHASWWPNMRDLTDEDIPVFRFLQRPGDMVWVNSGTIYWVQFSGWCNSIKWNVGPLTNEQFEMAANKYAWNKLHHVKSVVPMVHLSWNLARNIKMVDESLFRRIKSFILQSLQHYVIVSEYLMAKSIEPKIQPKKKHSKVQFCNHCGEEIFALIFVEELDGLANACCFTCAKVKDTSLKDFVCIQEYGLKELLFAYDSFQLHNQSSVHNSMMQGSMFGHPALHNSLMSYC